MHRAAEIVGYVNSVALGLLAVVTFVQWRRARHPGALWVFLTFATLGIIAVLGLFLPEDPEGQAWEWVTKILVAVLLLFPYFLYRVSASFVATSRTLDVVAAGVTMLVVGWTFGLQEFPGPDEPQTASFRAFVIALLIQWTFLSVVVAIRFWRAGRVQRSVASNRMKLLAIASVTLSLVLIVSGQAGNPEENPGLELATTAVTTLAVLAFFLAFAPPRFLRTIWIRPISDRLRAGTVQLMGATDESQVTDILLPAAMEVIGGEAIAVVDSRGQILGARGFESDGLDEARTLLSAATAEEHERLRPDLVSLRFNFGWLLIKTGPYTTFFGRDEIELLGALGALANLAIERVRAEGMKVELAQAHLRRQQALEINDNIVQGLAVAKYAFELNQHDRAKAAVDGTLDAARKIISDLLEELGDDANLLPGSLTRGQAASGYATGKEAS